MLQLVAQDNFIGTWTIEEGAISIEIYKHKRSYYAKVKNSENKEIIGKDVLIQMAKKSDTILYGGTYYDDELQEDYEAKIILVDKDTMRLKVFTGLFHKVLVWHRENQTN